MGRPLEDDLVEGPQGIRGAATAYRRRAERQESWLHIDLRQLLRKHWRDLATIVLGFTISAAAVLVVLHGHPLLQAGVAGLFLGLMTVSSMVFLTLMDCSLLSRFGRWVEELVGDELRTALGLYGVISNLPLPSADVDHVVLTPEGVYAMEVKTHLVRQRSLETTYDLPRKRGQAARGAAAAREILLQAGLDVPVRAVVVLAGPGAPPMTGPDDRGRVRVASFRRTGDWRPAPDPLPAMDRALAARVAEVLVAHRQAAVVKGGPGGDAAGADGTAQQVCGPLTSCPWIPPTPRGRLQGDAGSPLCAAVVPGGGVTLAR